MFGKLVKHDFIGSAHSLAPVYLVAAIIAGVTALSYAFDVTFLSAIGSLLLIIVVLAVVIITLFLIMSYFNKSMYTDQGYLTFTLPVKSRDVLASKIIVSFVWMVLSYAIMIGSLFLMVYFAKEKLGEEFGYEIGEIVDMIRTISGSGGLPALSNIIKIVVGILIYGFVSIMIIVATSFFSITLSNVRGFNKMGFFGGILIFVAIFIGMKIASSLIMAYFPMSLFLSEQGIKLVFKTMNDTSGAIGIGGTVFEAIASVLMIIGTSKLMTKKINLR